MPFGVALLLFLANLINYAPPSRERAKERADYCVKPRVANKAWRNSRAKIIPQRALPPDGGALCQWSLEMYSSFA